MTRQNGNSSPKWNVSWSQIWWNTCDPISGIQWSWNPPPQHALVVSLWGSITLCLTRLLFTFTGPSLSLSTSEQSRHVKVFVFQVLFPQLEFCPWRPGGKWAGGRGGFWTAGDPPEDHDAQLPWLSRQDSPGKQTYVMKMRYGSEVNVEF